jgi:hypothetical protein
VLVFLHSFRRKKERLVRYESLTFCALAQEEFIVDAVAETPTTPVEQDQNSPVITTESPAAQAISQTDGASSVITPWQTLESDIQARGCSTSLKAYYDIPKKEYLIRNSAGWIPQTEAQFKRRLKSSGVSTKTQDGEMLSPADDEILRIQDHESVTYSGALAGYREGLYTQNGLSILVTDGPRLIEPRSGDWPVLRAVFDAVLRDPNHDQLAVFYGWLHTAATALRRGDLMPGQALVLAGPARSGKSLIQNLITDILGGRSAKPYQFMTGGTQFNSELFKAEHLMIEDEAPSTDFRSRRNLGNFFKQLTVNEDQRLHAKGRDALMLKPFWRVTISLNDEPEDLHVLPPIDSSLEDKLILLRAYRRDLPMPASTVAERKLFGDTLRGEMPAFLHWLLTVYSIPEELKFDRFGVRHFHHPDLLEMLQEISNEARLMELINQHLDSPFDGTAAELETALYTRAPHQTRTLFNFTGAAGAYLAKLARMPNARVRKHRTAEGNRWQIWPVTFPIPFERPAHQQLDLLPSHGASM